MWFEDLVGFSEVNPTQVRSLLRVQGDRLTSAVNGRSFGCGHLTTPSLADLRAEVSAIAPSGRLRLSEVVADVQQLHLDPLHTGALFQACLLYTSDAADE